MTKQLTYETYASDLNGSCDTTDVSRRKTNIFLRMSCETNLT